MTAVADAVQRARAAVVPKEPDRRTTVRLAEKVVSRVERASASYPEVAGVALGGSFAKDTWLPRDVDIDVFVKVSPDVQEGRFEEVGLGVGREALRGYKPGKKYAQHPYTEATVDGFRVNVVPCYDVKPGEWKSAADRSVYHVDFVRTHLDEAARVEVRLLKRFMKAVGVYGAEIETEGFSGYASEVLVHNHGSLEEVLRWFAAFTPASKEAYFVLLDPIDQKRDLGRAISRETVARMVLASRAFLRRPSSAYFRDVAGRPRPRLASRAYAVLFEHEELSEDTLWGELRRSARQVAKHVREEGFALARADAASDNSTWSAIILLPVADSLPALEERPGPGVEMADSSERFVARNRKAAELLWVGEDGRLRLLTRRRFTSLGRLLEEMLGARLDRIGVSKEVGRALRRNGRVLSGERLRREAKKREWLRRGLALVVSDSVGV